jgi:hypothetical protein
MKEFAEIYNVKTEVICEDQKIHSTILHETKDSEFLALLSRRPCTVQGISAGLGLHINETNKRMQRLIEKGSIITVRKNNTIFYETVRTQKNESQLTVKF